MKGLWSYKFQGERSILSFLFARFVSSQRQQNVYKMRLLYLWTRSSRLFTSVQSAGTEFQPTTMVTPIFYPGDYQTKQMLSKETLPTWNLLKMKAHRRMSQSCQSRSSRQSGQMLHGLKMRLMNSKILVRQMSKLWEPRSLTKHSSLLLRPWLNCQEPKTCKLTQDIQRFSQSLEITIPLKFHLESIWVLLWRDQLEQTWKLMLFICLPTCKLPWELRSSTKFMELRSWWLENLWIFSL